jgi:hypothetical protein
LAGSPRFEKGVSSIIFNAGGTVESDDDEVKKVSEIEGYIN